MQHAHCLDAKKEKKKAYCELRHDSQRIVRTKQDDTRRKCRNHSSVSTLLHDPVYNWDGETTKNCRQDTHSHIRDVVFRVAIANVLKVEVTIEPNEPASEAEKELCEWRVDVKVVFS